MRTLTFSEAVTCIFDLVRIFKTSFFSKKLLLVEEAVEIYWVSRVDILCLIIVNSSNLIITEMFMSPSIEGTAVAQNGKQFLLQS